MFAYTCTNSIDTTAHKPEKGVMLPMFYLKDCYMFETVTLLYNAFLTVCSFCIEQDMPMLTFAQHFLILLDLCQTSRLGTTSLNSFAVTEMTNQM